jgi:hypothetical protein
MKINLAQISIKSKHAEFTALKNEAEKIYGVSL